MQKYTNEYLEASLVEALGAVNNKELTTDEVLDAPVMNFGDADQASVAVDNSDHEEVLTLPVMNFDPPRRK